MPEMELEIWRQLLGRAPNRKIIAEKMEVNYITISRWASGETTPRSSQDILKLAQTGKELGIDGLDEALREAYPDAFEVPEDPEVLEIPAVYYSTIMGIRASVAGLLLQYTAHNFVYDYMISQLDPGRDGLMLLFAQCVEPETEGGKVTRLRVASGRGTSFWSLKQIEHTGLEIGRATLCDKAVTDGTPVFHPPIAAPERSAPLLYPEKLQSIGAFPVTLCGENIAGVLFVASVKEDFFSHSRRDLLRHYANLFGQGLRNNQFYPHQRIELQ